MEKIYRIQDFKSLAKVFRGKAAVTRLAGYSSI